jgi:hypothetical protein
MTARTDQLPYVEAKCPECGLRVKVSSGEVAMTHPESLCKHAPWVRCPSLAPALSKARQSVW